MAFPISFYLWVGAALSLILNFSEIWRMSLVVWCMYKRDVRKQRFQVRCWVVIYIFSFFFNLIGKNLLRVKKFSKCCKNEGYRMVPFNMKVLAKFGLCSIELLAKI